MKKYFPIFIISIMSVSGFSVVNRDQAKGPILNHIALNVFDLKKSTAFYQNIMKLDTIPEPFHDGLHTWFSIGTNTSLHLIQRATEVTQHNKTNHVCFSVPSVDEFISRLKTAGIGYENLAGVAQSVTLRVDGIKQIYLRDPDGYWIEINDDMK